ncbi:MAG TPA: c-type cytochrome [Oligoflexus sp.]|uniref:c-type cytochrome n=1 Tax=Oligoflexus sp. TaxID=1971216 RepID=UPI002D7F0981|nr:c-type cytochrome [Oligoflexus sp.]HET9239066.1 c-type cytochrome [Oligoflexus sp.]
MKGIVLYPMLSLSLLASAFAAESRPVPVTSPGATPGPVFIFEAPDDKDIPAGEFGRMVRRGQDIFMNTAKELPDNVGNSLRCVNCHLDRGRLANSAPLWAAYPMYPAYRKKTNKVDTIEERIQGCFQFSMNGKAPALDSEAMKALVTYNYWLSKGAPTGMELPGRGYPELPKPSRRPSPENGKNLYTHHCSICHGPDGQGQMTRGEMVFPPLWGAQSYNWGAGMHRVNTAASFIKHNMPLGKGNTISNEDAWDLAAFVNSHERPQDPRFKGNLEETDKVFHDENCLYGERVNHVKLGSRPANPD